MSVQCKKRIELSRGASTNVGDQIKNTNPGSKYVKTHISLTRDMSKTNSPRAGINITNFHEQSSQM